MSLKHYFIFYFYFLFFPLTVKSQNPLVKGLKLSNSYEDFELKKLLFNIIVILCKDLPTIQVKKIIITKIKASVSHFVL